MKQAITLKRSRSGKLHRTTCHYVTQAHENYSDVTVADEAAFKLIEYHERDSCLNPFSYPYIRYEQSSAEEQAYWDAPDPEKDVRDLLDSYERTTDEGRDLLRPRIRAVLSALAAFSVADSEAIMAEVYKK